MTISKLQYDFLIVENTALREKLKETVVTKDKEIAELKALLGGDLKELPRVDMGVSVEEKQALWPNEERIDVISQNGATGEHYARMGGRSCGKTIGGGSSSIGAGSGD